MLPRCCKPKVIGLIHGITKDGRSTRTTKPKSEMTSSSKQKKKLFVDPSVGVKVDPEQFEKILNCIRSGVDSGATLDTGEEIFDVNGYYIKPTVFSNVKGDMLIAKEEISGPVHSIRKFKYI